VYVMCGSDIEEQSGGSSARVCIRCSVYVCVFVLCLFVFVYVFVMTKQMTSRGPEYEEKIKGGAIERCPLLGGKVSL